MNRLPQSLLPRDLIVSRRRAGFTLVEMLVVIAIISILLTGAGPVFDSLATSQSPAAAASVISGQLERARSHAITKNTYVWVRLGKVAEEPNDFFIGVYESLDGSDQVTATTKGIWSAPRLPNFNLSNSLNSSFVRPVVPSANQANVASWVRFSRGVRWDSDHVVTLDDALQAIAAELVRNQMLSRTHIGLDFFDASINRIAAWTIGTRNTLKALLIALLEPPRLRQAEKSGDYTSRLAIMEEAKGLPWGAVWDAYCESQNVPAGAQWLAEVKQYESSVLGKRN